MSIGNHGLEDGRDYELTIGSSFRPSKAKESYHLMRYDFKPASIDTSRPAEFVVGESNQCTVTIPNIHDAGTTTYKGGKKPCTKECVLIIDKETGQITLERISSNIPLKKCRADKSEKKASVVPSKSTKPLTQNTSKSASSHNQAATSTLSNHTPHSTPTVSAPPSLNHHVGNLNSSSSNLNSSASNLNSNGISSKRNGNHLRTKPPVQKTRTTSGTSVSSVSSTSESSDSDSGDDGDPLATQMEAFAVSKPKIERPPPAPAPAPVKETTVRSKPEKTFLSTLQSDLQLSDSSDSD